MKTRTWFFGVVLGTLASALGALAAPAPESKADVDPEARDVLRRWSDQAKSLTNATIHIEETIDEVLPTGQKVQYSHAHMLTISRPDKFKIETTGDISNVSIWKDDKTLSFLYRDENEYAQIPASGTTEETLKMLMERYGIALPLADYFSGDPYKVLMSEVQVGAYLGLHHVGQTKCHHVLFVEEDIDWQGWFEQGDHPRLLKLVITYKNLPGQPQFTARNMERQKLSQASEDVNRFTPPTGAKKIEFAPVARSTTLERNE